MKVLIVEDDRNLVLAMSLRLRSEGHSVDAEPDAPSAISTAAKNSPDIAIIDINLPRGDGFSVAQDLLNSPETENIPFAFMTGSDDFELKQKSETFGAIGFLEKPFRSSQLTALLAER